MKKTTTIIILGFLIILMPFLGFPQSWEKTFFIFIGLIIIVITFSIRSKVNNQNKANQAFDFNDEFIEGKESESTFDESSPEKSEDMAKKDNSLDSTLEEVEKSNPLLSEDNLLQKKQNQPSLEEKLSAGEKEEK